MQSARRGFLKALAVVPLAPRTEGTATQPQNIEAILADAAARAVPGAFQGAAAADVTKAIASGQKAAQALRAARILTNADEPVAVFAARPQAGGRP